MRKKSKKREFSKSLLIQESILLWIVTIAFIILGFYCVVNQYFGELPWLTALAGFPWSAYGVSQVYYYKKSALENTKGGIKYADLMKDLDEAYKNAYEKDSSPLEDEISSDSIEDEDECEG